MKMQTIFCKFKMVFKYDLQRKKVSLSLQAGSLKRQIMKQHILQQAVANLNWFHTMNLPAEDGVVTTPGIVKHTTADQATNRFGMMTDYAGATVLDIGCYDGFFSFEAERRKAGKVIAIDPLQPCSRMKHTADGFRLAHSCYRSNVQFYDISLAEYARRSSGGRYHIGMVDVSLYYGVLYHTDAPLAELKLLRKVTRHHAIIETACIHARAFHRPTHYWRLEPGHSGDDTNQWYPTIGALIDACGYAGFTKTEVINVQPDKTRCTVKAYCI